MTAAAAIERHAAEVLQLPREFADVFGGTRAVRRARRTRRLPRVEYLFKRGDGREIELGISTAILTTPRGEVGFVFTFQDVTEARRHEREARIQQRLAAVGEMAAGIAHEIRNPLASMSGSLQILRQELPLTDEQSQLMDIVLRESDRLNDTIRSFLAYARPQRNAPGADRRPPGRHRRGDAAAEQPGAAGVAPRSAATCRTSRSGALPTKPRFGRSSGTWRPTGCGRCPTAARLTLAAATGEQAGTATAVTLAVSDEGIGIDRRGGRRHPAAVPRRLRPRHRPRPVDRPPHRQRLRRRAAGDARPEATARR